MPDAMSAHNVSVEPDGSITYDFDGRIHAEGIDFDGTSGSPALRTIKWTRAVDGSTVAEIVGQETGSWRGTLDISVYGTGAGINEPYIDLEASLSDAPNRVSRLNVTSSDTDANRKVIAQVQNAAGAFKTATILDGQGRSAFPLKAPYCRIRNSLNWTSTASTTWQKFTGFDVVDFDNADAAQADLANDRIVITTPGVYTIKASVFFDFNGAGNGTYRGLALRRNGSDLAADLVQALAIGNGNRMTTSGDYAFGVGDTLELWIAQDTGAGLGLFGNAAHSVILSAAWHGFHLPTDNPLFT